MPLSLTARVGISLALREGMMFHSRQKEKERMHECAAHRVGELKRPLVVIGEHGIDPAELHVGCGGYKDDSCVVLVLYGLETVPEVGENGQPGIEEAWAEIVRVAGSSSNIFVTHHKGSLVAALDPSVNWKIESAPPMSPGLAYRARKKFKVPLISVKAYR